MYAIIAESGRQYRVEEGQVLEVDYRDVAPGSEIKFERVLALSDDDGMTLGAPVVDGASLGPRDAQDIRQRLIVGLIPWATWRAAPASAARLRR